MDFTTSGRDALALGLRNQGSNLKPWNDAVLESDHGLTFFSELPNQNDRPARTSPVLVMPPPSPIRRGRVWAQRIWLVVFVLFCLEVGIILMWCPWTRVWSENSILVSFPRLREFLMLGFVRGVISGLGLVNIWMGIAEAVRYRENHE